MLQMRIKWILAVCLLGYLLLQNPLAADAPNPVVQTGSKIAVQPAQAQTADAAQEQVKVAPSELYPGDVAFLTYSKPGAVTLWNHTYTLQPYEGKFVAFIPIPIEQKPGSYPILLASHKQIASITVKPKTFASDSITVTKQMESMKSNTKRIGADQQKINRARSHSSDVPYFSGKFQLPVVGKLTTPYGYRRIVNKKPDSPHLAIDLANKTGTSIVAAHNGKVVLADTMYLNGNMIIIDHGLHVFATYSHLSKLEVKTGDFVKQGQEIGRVGTTGFSTGPHLHYAMLIDNQFVNPDSFFQSAFIPQHLHK